jgi:hypothetical protein
MDGRDVAESAADARLVAVEEKTGASFTGLGQGIGNSGQQPYLRWVAQIRHMLDERAVAIEDESGWRFHEIQLCER